MPRGSADEGKMTMVYKSKGISSSGRSSSYIQGRPTRSKEQQKASRKNSVENSLMKFLDDCGDEDLLMNTITSPAATRTSLSLSEHGRPRAVDPLFSPTGEDNNKPKRRGKKPDATHNHLPIRRSTSSTTTTSGIDPLKSPTGTISHSEHGTPSTSKSPGSQFKPKKVLPSVDYDDDDDDDSDNNSFADEGGEREERKSSRSSKRHSSSSTTHRSRKSSGSSSKKERSKSSRSSSSSSRRDVGNPQSPLSMTSPSGRLRRTRSDRSTTNSPSASSTTSTVSKRGGDESTRGEMRRSSSIRSERGLKAERRKSEGAMGVNMIDRHLERTNGRRRSGRHGHEDDNGSVASGRSSYSTMSTRSHQTLGLDAGPLNAFLNAGHQQQQRLGRQSFGAASVGPGIHPDLEEYHHDEEEFLRERKARQDDILKKAQSERWKAQNDGKIGNSDNENTLHHDNNGIPDGEDDDQPMVKGKRNGVLARFKKGLSATSNLTKSTAKGTVNVVKDPKRAAKKVGGFAKDVGKETVNMVLNPKLAANAALDVTRGTYKVTKGVGKGVAMGGIGLTRTVAMTGVNATTMVVGTALDGAGKVVHGATELIFKHGHEEQLEKLKDYNAAELESRRKSNTSLLDRVSGVVRSDSSSELRSDTFNGKDGSGGDGSSNQFKRQPNSLVVAALVVDTKRKDSWDF